MSELNLYSQDNTDVSGLYNIITDNSNVSIHNNILNYGKASILTKNNATTLIGKNKYYVGENVVLTNDTELIGLTGTVSGNSGETNDIVNMFITLSSTLKLPEISYERIPNVLTFMQNEMSIQNVNLIVPTTYSISDETSSLFAENFKNISGGYFSSVSGELYDTYSGAVLNNLLTSDYLKNNLNTEITSALIGNYTSQSLNSENSDKTTELILNTYKTDYDIALSGDILTSNFAHFVNLYQDYIISDFIKNNKNSNNCLNYSGKLFSEVSGNIFNTIRGNLPSYLDTDINSLKDILVTGTVLQNPTINGTSATFDNLGIDDFSLAFSDGIYDFYGETIYTGLQTFTISFTDTSANKNRTIRLTNTDTSTGYIGDLSGTVSKSTNISTLADITSNCTFKLKTITGDKSAAIKDTLYNTAFNETYNEFLSGDIYSIQTILLSESVSAIIENGFTNFTNNISNETSALIDNAANVLVPNYISIAGSGNIYEPIYNYLNGYVGPSGVLNPENNNNKDIAAYNVNITILDESLESFILNSYDTRIISNVYNILLHEFNDSFNDNFKLLSANMSEIEFLPITEKILSSFEQDNIDYVSAKYITESVADLSGTYERTGDFIVSNVTFIPNTETNHINDSHGIITGNYEGAGTFVQQNVDINETPKTITYVSNGTFIHEVKNTNDNLTEHIITNTDAARVTLLDNTVLPYKNETITVNNKGSILNFPAINEETANRCDLINFNTKTPITAEVIKNIKTSTINWSQQLITNGDVTAWSKADYSKKIYNVDNSELEKYIKNILTAEIIKENQHYNINTQIANTNNEIEETQEKFNKLVERKVNKIIKSDFIYLITAITETTNNEIHYINESLKALPKNLYKRNIRIYFDINQTAPLFTERLAIKDFYNGNIIIENINKNARTTFLSRSINLSNSATDKDKSSCTILDVRNCDNVKIKNLNFSSCYNTGSFAYNSSTKDNLIKNYGKDLYLVYLENIKQCDFDNCELNNLVPRPIGLKNPINYSTYTDNVLFYETYSLIYCTNSNVTLTDITLRKSNIGVIARLNSTVNYNGTTKIEFYGYTDKEDNLQTLKIFGFDTKFEKYFENNGKKIPYNFTGFNHAPFYGPSAVLNPKDTPVQPLGNGIETTQLEFDFVNPSVYTNLNTNTETEEEFISLFWKYTGIDKTNFETIGEYTQSIINYAAENSCITMFPYSSIYNIAKYADNTVSLNAKAIEEEYNYILGCQQLGSLFNHTHIPMDLKITAATDEKQKQILEKLNKKLTESSTFKFDSFPGMMSIQYAGNLFELNDPNESIGYQYIDVISPNNNVLPIGQYIQTKYVNGYNTVQNANNLSGITTERVNYIGSVGQSCIPYAKVGIGEKMSTYITNDSTKHNIGNFWTQNLTTDNEFKYNLQLFNNNGPDYYARVENAIDSLKSLNGEDLLTVSLFQNYFSSNNNCISSSVKNSWEYNNSDNAVPIGIWSRPINYVNNTGLNASDKVEETLSPTTFVISDRYNKVIRDTFNLNDIIIADKFTSEYFNNNKKQNPVESIPANNRPNFGNTVFYYDRSAALIGYNIDYSISNTPCILSGLNKLLAKNDYTTDNLISSVIDFIEITGTISAGLLTLTFTNETDSQEISFDRSYQTILTSGNLFDVIKNRCKNILTINTVMVSVNRPKVTGYNNSNFEPIFESLKITIKAYNTSTSNENKNNGLALIGVIDIPFDADNLTKLEVSNEDIYKDFYDKIADFAMCGQTNTETIYNWSAAYESDEYPDQLCGTIIPDVNTKFDLNMPYIRTCEYFGYNPLHHIKLCEGVKPPYNFYEINANNFNNRTITIRY